MVAISMAVKIRAALMYRCLRECPREFDNAFVLVLHPASDLDYEWFSFTLLFVPTASCHHKALA